MQFISEHRLDDGAVESQFILNEIPGLLWMPGSPSEPVPLILLGHPAGWTRCTRGWPNAPAPASAYGFAAATVELPGSGDRPRWPDVDQARADLQNALAAGEPVDEIIDRLVLPLLVEKAVPEWQTALDALLALP